MNEIRRKDQILILQERLAALGEMISNIAHQWRQPLNVLGIYQQDLPLAYETAEFTREHSVRQRQQIHAFDQAYVRYNR
ncbi:MAG: hypothetical protein PHY09_16935 [Desulfuromonadaceae bacterium]|nr:hypothetical protein [Desulfuromonadaceae bacterium]MDD5107010.1 hypothetical protein [Desulfuromonadaceae bacterium]